MMRKLWDRLSGPILAQLKQGLSPAKAALAVALGLYIAIIPALGTTTVLCLLAGLALRLNQPILQAVNWAAYPLQLLLLFPFFGLGADAFGGPVMTLSPSEFIGRVGSDPMGVMRDFWWIGIHAIGVWAMAGLVAVPVLWLGFRALFGRFKAEPA